MTPPSKFAHIVYRTHRFEEMIDWYRQVFEATVQYQSDQLAFLTYDDEHHRFAFVNLGPTGDAAADAYSPGGARGRRLAGVDHVAYTWSTVTELLGTFERLKNLGVHPARSLKHGPTLSMYYYDPDGNGMEFQVDLLDIHEANDFMRGPQFHENPIGERFDPDELARRIAGGESPELLALRSDQMPR